MRHLAKQLRAIKGWDITEEHFKKTVEDVFNEYFSRWTDDELLCHPHDALRFDDWVRYRLGNPNIPDALINRTLINIRKANRSKHQRGSKRRERT